MAELLRLVVKNENVALTDMRVLEEAQGYLDEVLHHIHVHGLQNSGQDWVEMQLQMVENRILDVLNKLDGIEREGKAHPVDFSPPNHGFVKYSPGPDDKVTVTKKGKKT